MTLKVREAMTSHVKCIRSDVALPALERRLDTEGVTCFAVVDDGVFRGEVSLRDILRKLDEERSEAETATGFWEEGAGVDSPLPASEWVSSIVGKHMDHLMVKDVMNPHALVVSPYDSLVEVARSMKNNLSRRAFVVDEEKEVVGIVTGFDFVCLYADSQF